MLMIYIRHVRKAKYCLSGTRAFFKKHNLDYQDFVKNGIIAQNLLDTGDAMAARVVEIAKDEQWQQETNNRL